MNIANPVIREEVTADIDAIREVTIAAFANLEISNQTEHIIIDKLREAGALKVSLVAELDGQVVGHIAFSQVVLTDKSPGWYGLGPVSVLPGYQGNGIGSRLIETGLDRLRRECANGCCLVGHPEYYRRFGFINPPGLVLEGVPKEVFFAISFTGPIPEGNVTFHAAFSAGSQASS